MHLVIVESPYAGIAKWDVEDNINYARECMRDCLMRGEAPFASHLLYTQDNVLDDDVSEERFMGMEAGFAWMEKADMVAVYGDRGISRGMKDGIRRAIKLNKPLEFRMLYSDDKT